MYNKNRCEKIMYQAIIDNRIGIEFNTSKKRDAFVSKVAKMQNHMVTYISNVAYPWNPEDGMHGLISPEDFANLLKCSISKVYRAMKNGYLQTERIGDNEYMVNSHDTYRIKGGYYIFKK